MVGHSRQSGARDLQATLFDRDLLRSLALIGSVVVMACIALVMDENWPKLLRVSTAASTYVAMLAALRFWNRQARPSRPLDYGFFLLAGLLAGAVSGSVRSEFSLGLFVAQVLAGGILVSGVHWFALVRWREVRRLMFRDEAYGS